MNMQYYLLGKVQYENGSILPSMALPYLTDNKPVFLRVLTRRFNSPYDLHTRINYRGGLVTEFRQDKPVPDFYSPKYFGE